MGSAPSRDIRRVPQPAIEAASGSPSDCGIGDLLRRRETALGEYMRLDEMLFFAMKRKIAAVTSADVQLRRAETAPGETP